MYQNFVLVKIDYHYCDFLRKYDYRVPYNKNIKELRPFVGIIFKIGDIEYFAPLASPKPKHLKMFDSFDFMQLDGGKLGAINFNNMIPVLKNSYFVLNVNVTPEDKSEQQYYRLLKQQLQFLNANRTEVIDKASHLYRD